MNEWTSDEFAELYAMVCNGNLLEQKQTALSCCVAAGAAGVKDVNIKDYLIGYVPTKEDEPHYGIAELMAEIKSKPEVYK